MPERPEQSASPKGAGHPAAEDRNKLGLALVTYAATHFPGQPVVLGVMVALAFAIEGLFVAIRRSPARAAPG